MTAIDPKRVQALFLQAVEASDDAARRAMLDRECNGDSSLRARVDELLQAHNNSGTFLAEPIVQPIVPEDERKELPAVVADRYRLLEQIGEGGMGTVWVAEQREPLKRLVALKLIKPGMDSRQVLARFEAERQALAVMDHPNIAKVFDGGATDAGHPFFVMEYVNGAPITEYCDERQLSLPDRLQLFVQVCQAVQHAHQKGIIHRDLKPSNVLVCLYDETAVPKVIDFGLAKAMHQPLTEQTLYTAHGLVVGTPLYMSPEQAEFNNLDIDTRSDVYSLGVILYELLTGTTPLEKQRFKEQAWQEIVRLIKEEEPPRPSTKLSRSATLPTVAAQRSLEPTQLGRAIRGDLDWIVMKALEKERARRYDTAAGLARDIEHYLHDEPVEACPPSATYRLKKLVRRNKGIFVAGTAVLLALVAGVVGTTLGLIEARRQERIAAAAAGEEKKAREAESLRAEAEATERKRAEVAEKLALERLGQVTKEKFRADRSLEIARAVNAFMAHDILGQADPRVQADANFAPDPDLKIRTAIDRAAKKVGSAFAGKPMIEAAIRRTIGDAYQGIGDYSEAIAQLERAAELLEANGGPDDRNALATRSNLVGAYRDAGKIKEAITLGEKLRDAWTKVAGPDSNELLATLATLGLAYRAENRTTEAISTLERALEINLKKVDGRHQDVFLAQNDLALAYIAAGRQADAVRLAKQARDGFVELYGEEHPSTLNSKLALAQALRSDRKPAEAIAILEPLVESFAKAQGANHPVSLIAQHSLASAYVDAGRGNEAIAIGEKVHKLRRDILGADHPDTFAIQVTLARAYYHGGKTDEATSLLKQVQSAQEAKLGPNHPDVERTKKFLADISEQSRPADAD
jgi:eukaryotic-like serine/threonine-protein kinase